MIAGSGNNIPAASIAGINIAGTGAQAISLPLPPVPSLIPTAATTGAFTATANSNPTANQGVPNLSNAAFETLMDSVNGVSGVKEASGIGNGGTIKTKFASRGGLTAGGDLPPVQKGTIRDAGLEINRLLRPHARQEP